MKPCISGPIAVEDEGCSVDAGRVGWKARQKTRTIDEPNTKKRVAEVTDDRILKLEHLFCFTA